MIRVWDTRTRNIIRVFRHAKGMSLYHSVIYSKISLFLCHLWEPDRKYQVLISLICSPSGPVNNVMVTRQPQLLNPRTSAPTASSRKQALTLPPPLEKFANSPDENTHVKVLIGGQDPSNGITDSSYVSVQAMEAQIRELQVLILCFTSKFSNPMFIYKLVRVMPDSTCNS